ncbi:nucleotide pyrophosphohydrolase [Gemmatimonas groenlandica]|uniref:Nucleotide pyrophosphohydrolase n=1 Tax=Gemmatimonas groenlandica TaxID=2732249 RepID=A0A6M4INY3_9BACT|nr:nucleotide pyrophosphohydrolase [Gemmatimonas groenlandica]QJR35217.1 nucleotide pyrophosphohydrolase [Gemmatimonas groenlandica]
MSEILAFRDARDWKQFHTPKNLAAALSIEVGELQETLLWKTDEQITESLRQTEKFNRIRDEVADVLIYALLFAEATGVDPVTAIRSKLQGNAEKYPVETSKGSALKYSELPSTPKS